VTPDQRVSGSLNSLKYIEKNIVLRKSGAIAQAQGKNGDVRGRPLPITMGKKFANKDIPVLCGSACIETSVT